MDEEQQLKRALEGLGGRADHPGAWQEVERRAGRLRARRDALRAVSATGILVTFALIVALGYQTISPGATIIIDDDPGPLDSTGDEAVTTAPSEVTLEPSDVLLPAPEAMPDLNPGVRFEEISVEFWSEYDSLDVLVLADLTLPQDVEFPVHLRLALPVEARFTGFAEIRPDGSYDYSRPAPSLESRAGPYQIYAVVAPERRHLRVEYYQDLEVEADGRREISVAYPLPGAADRVNVGVQEPLRATAFSVDPPLPVVETDEQGFDEQGFTYHRAKLGSVPSHRQVSLDLSYRKTDERGSVMAPEEPSVVEPRESPMPGWMEPGGWAPEGPTGAVPTEEGQVLDAALRIALLEGALPDLNLLLAQEPPILVSTESLRGEWFPSEFPIELDLRSAEEIQDRANELGRDFLRLRFESFSVDGDTAQVEIQNAWVWPEGEVPGYSSGGGLRMEFERREGTWFGRVTERWIP